MKHLFRSLFLALVLVQASIALAQPVPPYTITVNGTVAGCTPNTYVNIISVQGTQPALDIDVPVDPSDCSFWVALDMDSFQGWFEVSTQCGGVNQTQDMNYTVNALDPDSTFVTVVFNCGNAIDCMGVPGGNSLPGTPCNTPAGNAGVFDADCNCIPTSTALTACISMDQTAPFTAVFSSCTTGGTPAYANLWDFSDGGAVPGDNISHTYAGPGTYAVCINVTDADGFFDAICETVYVDANGGISFDPPTGCLACFTVSPVMNGNNPVPFQASFINCSTGALATTYIWTLPNGLNSSQQNQPNYTFNAPGIYGLCLQITDGMGCTSELCDTIVVDPNGGINTIPVWYDCMGVLWGNSTAGTPCNHPVTGPGTWSADCDCVPNATVYDCLQIPNGPNMPGTPCQQAGFVGTWDADCNCVPNSPGDCEAGFWVLQAYENGDTTGTGTPIPNTLWVWNLTNGGTGFYQFVWDFGDGSTSTEAFPTHIYADSGPYELCLTITDSDGCTDTYCDSVSVDEDGLYSGLIGDTGNRTALTLNVVNPLTTGIDEEGMLATISLWPNPARELLNIALDSRTAGSVRLEVVDLNGRIVLERQEQLNLGGNRLQLGTEDLPAGLYALRISQGTNVITQRFVRD
ncbi:MAG: PKD domain-containing protein [Flavobacteriales bacterium]